MRILLDNNVNHRFGRLINDHEVVHARAMGWAELENGDLIASAEQAGFDVLITGDKQMQYQQALAGRTISVIVLNGLFLKWEFIEPLASQVQATLNDGLPKGSFVVIHPKESM